MHLFYRPFNSKPKKEDTDNGQYEFLKMKKITKMNNSMCEIFNKLNIETWKINDKKFTVDEYKTFLAMVIEAEAYSVTIMQSKSQQILELLPMPHFTNLRELIINNNNVSNIESLEFLNAPRLVWLDLKDNHIFSLKVFRKLRMDELQVVCLSWNKIISQEQLKAIGRFVTDKKKEEWVDLSGYAYKKAQTQNWFEYDSFRQLPMINAREQDPVMYQQSKNELLFRQIQDPEMVKKFVQVPFLAKCIANVNKKQRVKIIY